MIAAVPLLAIDFTNPLFWAVIVGWILSVTLHEFAHGAVAYLGGDYTIRERGGLTLNPLQYADPMMTFVLPMIFVLLGGVPLMGASTYVNTSLLRSRGWRTAVSLAGPATNFLLFLVVVIPLHPRVGWVRPFDDPATWSSLQIFCGAMAVLELISVFLNLLPIPPLDGFNAIEVYLPDDVREKLRGGQVRLGCLVVLFILLQSQKGAELMGEGVVYVLRFLRFDFPSRGFIFDAYQKALFK